MDFLATNLSSQIGLGAFCPFNLHNQSREGSTHHTPQEMAGILTPLDLLSSYPLRIQVCPKEGIAPIYILRMGLEPLILF